MSKPIISITDHMMRGHTHNVVVKFEYPSFDLHYYTYCDTTDDISYVRERLQETLELLGMEKPNTSVRFSIYWQDDF